MLVGLQAISARCKVVGFWTVLQGWTLIPMKNSFWMMKKGIRGSREEESVLRSEKRDNQEEEENLECLDFQFAYKKKWNVNCLSFNWIAIEKFDANILS